MNIRAGIDQSRTRLGIFLTRYPNFGKIGASVVWLSVDKCRLLVSVIVSAWTARYLEPAGFGTLNYAIALIALVSVISDLGLETLTVRNLVRETNAAPEILGTVFGLRLVIGIACYALLIGASAAFSASAQMHSLLLILGLSIFIQPMLTIRCWFQAELSAKLIFAANNVAFVATTAARIGLIVFHRPLVDFAWVAVAETIVIGVCMWLFYHQTGATVASWRFSALRAKELLHDCWPLMISGLAVMVYMRIDQAMLGSMIGPHEVGIYSAAVRISELWYFVPTILASSLFPSIVRARTHSPERYMSRLQHYFDLNAGLAYLLILPGIVFAAAIVRLAFSSVYAGAQQILVIHLWASIFVFLGVAREQFLIAEGLVRFSLVSTVLGALMNIGLNIVLIPRFAGVGAAWATVVSYAFTAIISSFLFERTRTVAVMQMRALAVPFTFKRLFTLISRA